jgi:hypothetical protein
MLMLGIDLSRSRISDQHLANAISMQCVDLIEISRNGKYCIMPDYEIRGMPASYRAIVIKMDHENLPVNLRGFKGSPASS